MKFQFNLEGEHLNSSLWAYDNGYIEGDLQVYINGALFLNEMYANVLELAIQLGKWLQKVENDDVCDFVYDSIDRDESSLQFYMHEQGLLVRSLYEQQRLEPLPIETVKMGVLDYLIELHVALHRIGYEQRLGDLLKGFVSVNKWALILLEGNEYDEAFALIEKLAKQKPSAQSLNNYAWFLLREEEDRERAWEVLQQVLPLQPQSDFPYLMLGEIAIHHKQFEQAKAYLQQALHFRVSEIAMYNLAMAHFCLGEYEQAATYFSRCDGDSGLTQLHEVVSWMHAGQMNKAKALLDNWNEAADDYTGAIEIADVYIELGCFAEAREQFKKEWQQYFVSPYIVRRYAYTLLQVGDMEACRQVVQQAIENKKQELVDEEQRELDEHWSVQDRAECLVECKAQLEELETLLQRLEQGFVPAFDYDMYPDGGCQLFGCQQHGHTEYEELT